MKRILIISSEPINNRTGTGITLGSIFTHIPNQYIAVLYSANISPDYSVTNRVFKFNPRKAGIFSKFFSHFGTQSYSNTNSNSKINYLGQNSKKLWLHKLKPFIVSWADILNVTLDSNLKKWLQDFCPELVYTVSGNIQITNLATEVSRQFQIPIVVHFMDDWLSTVYVQPYFILQNILLKRAIHSMISRVNVGLAISSQMAHEYENLFHIPFQVLGNIPSKNNSNTNLNINNSAKCVKLRYIGGLHLNRWTSLKLVVSAVSMLVKKGHSISIEIFSQDNPFDYWGDIGGDHILYMGCIPQEEVLDIVGSADILVHVESFEPSDIRYTRLSISTKISQYMKMSKPILAVGSNACASLQCISDSGGGCVITEKSEIKIAKEIEKIAVSLNLRKEMGYNSFQYFQKHFSFDAQYKVIDFIFGLTK